MGRYRPPRASGSPYITPEGEAALRAELHALWKVERPEVTKAVSAAAANGDCAGAGALAVLRGVPGIALASDGGLEP